MECLAWICQAPLIFQLECSLHLAAAALKDAQDRIYCIDIDACIVAVDRLIVLNDPPWVLYTSKVLLDPVSMSVPVLHEDMINRVHI